jgi:hypothetical protein
MSNNGKILKTGALAVSVTIAFAVFVFYGQRTGDTTFTVVRVLPQIAVGSFDGNRTKYSTVIEIVNTSTTSVNVAANFYETTGGTASTLSFATNLTAVPAITGGALASTALDAGKVLVITGNTATTGTVNWAKIQSTGNVSIAAFFETRDNLTNVLYSRVGVTASPANMRKFLIPRVRNVATGFEVAYALVNTGSTAASYTATLNDATGAVLKAKTDTLAAGAQTAKFAFQFFDLSGEPAGTSYSYIVVESSSAQFAAIAIAFEGAAQTSFPVDQLQ